MPSLVTMCAKDCGSRVMVVEDKVFDAPRAGLLEELGVGTRMMPESLRAVVVSRNRMSLAPVDSRVIYLNLHRCRGKWRDFNPE